MKKTVEYINHVLAEWDPIGVGKDIATDEYKGYIPSILRVIDDKRKLMNCLEDILINKIGTGYDPNNHEHLLDLQAVCEKIIQANKISKSSH